MFMLLFVESFSLCFLLMITTLYSTHCSTIESDTSFSAIQFSDIPRNDNTRKSFRRKDAVWLSWLSWLTSLTKENLTKPRKLLNSETVWQRNLKLWPLKRKLSMNTFYKWCCSRCHRPEFMFLRILCSIWTEKRGSWKGFDLFTKYMIYFVNYSRYANNERQKHEHGLHVWRKPSLDRCTCITSAQLWLTAASWWQHLLVIKQTDAGCSELHVFLHLLLCTGHSFLYVLVLHDLAT